jgi:hypothetical protein
LAAIAIVHGAGGNRRQQAARALVQNSTGEIGFDPGFQLLREYSNATGDKILEGIGVDHGITTRR